MPEQRSSLFISNPVRLAPVGGGGGGGGFSSYVFTDNPTDQDAPGSTTVTFSSVAIGTANANRIVVAGFSSTGNIATSCTIGGISATKLIEESSVASGLQIWDAAVPTGTTANVVFSFGGNPNNCCLAVGSFVHGASSTPTDLQSTTDGGGAVNTFTLNLTIPTGGFGVEFLYSSIPIVINPTWTNTTSPSGDSSQQVNSNTAGWFSAHSTTVGSPTTISADVGVNFLQGHAVGASWGP